MNYDDFIELVKTRRSIRRFKQDPLPEGALEKILEAARWGMSGGNGQPWEFVVVTKQETKDKIAEYFAGVQDKYWDIEKTRRPELRTIPYSESPKGKGKPGIVDAPVILAICGDLRVQQTSVLAGPFLLSEGSADANFYKGLACATQIMHLAVHSLGLASQWFSVNYPWEGHLKNLLDVPDEFKIVSLVGIGYPAYVPPPGWRRERSEIVHYEKYDRSKYRTGDDIIKFTEDLRKRSRAVYKKWWG